MPCHYSKNNSCSDVGIAFRGNGDRGCVILQLNLALMTPTWLKGEDSGNGGEDMIDWRRALGVGRAVGPQALMDERNESQINLIFIGGT